MTTFQSGIRSVSFDHRGNLVIELHEPVTIPTNLICIEKADVAALAEAIKDPPGSNPNNEASFFDVIKMQWMSRRRPQNYAELNAQEQWEIDKRLGLLDDEG